MTIKLPIKFIKAQAVAILASIIDFSITYGITSFGNQWYVLSSSIGIITGGWVAFYFGRNWVFDVSHEKKRKQILRYILIWLSSLVLNIGGTYILTEHIGLYYMASKISVAICIGISFNYFLQKKFVFKTNTVTVA